MKSVNLELGIDDLADFLFVKNKANALVELELNGISDTRDLYCFCIDLLFKGLVLVCCGYGRSLEIESISNEQFREVMDKMKLAGILVMLAVEEKSENEPPGICMGEAYKSKRILELAEYTFTMTSSEKKYDVNFKLSRPAF